MAATVVGMFDSASEATQVRQELVTLGIPQSDIRISQESAGTSGAASAGMAGESSKSLWQEFKEMFTGDDERDYAGYYAEGARRGHVVVTVNTTDELADRAAEILRSHGAVDIDNRAAEWRSSGWSGYTPDADYGSTTETTTTRTAAAATQPATAGYAAADMSANTASRAVAGQQNVAVPVVEEQLELGKRQVQRGGVRVVRRVTEKPVSESINLHEEHVNVDRRAVNRDLTGRDLDEAFTDKTIEVTETAEVPVAAKTARVVEEVVINKEATDRTEQVRDTVRRSDVQVERLPGQDVAERSTTKTGELTAEDVGSTTSRKVNQ